LKLIVMDHDPYFDPPPSGGGDVGMGAPAAEPKLDVDTRDILPDLGAGSKRQRSPPRHDYDRDPGQDRSPRRRRFDGPPPGFDQRLDNGNGRPVGGGGGRGGRGRGKGTGRDDEGPLSFREFCVRHVSDTTTPAEAEQKYETYRKERADSFRRAISSARAGSGMTRKSAPRTTRGSSKKRWCDARRWQRTRREFLRMKLQTARSRRFR